MHFELTESSLYISIIKFHVHQNIHGEGRAPLSKL